MPTKKRLVTNLTGLDMFSLKFVCWQSNSFLYAYIGSFLYKK